MNAFIVCVDFADLLAITLPYNRHHFENVYVITSGRDQETIRYLDGLRDPGVHWFATESFYDDGAVFNKWKALEHGLDCFGRDGWICLMDADVLWPKDTRCRVECWEDPLPVDDRKESRLLRGNLYTPRRRMWENWPTAPDWQPFAEGIHAPLERDWNKFPLHPQQREFAGYTQIFYGSDPVLGPPPWHETNWRHAGGADSFFQAKWPEDRKVRPPFEVLHLGPAGMNWCGRASRKADGSEPDGAEDRRRQLRDFVRGRTSGPARFDRERI